MPVIKVAHHPRFRASFAAVIGFRMRVPIQRLRRQLALIIALVLGLSACSANPPEVEGLVAGSDGVSADVLTQSVDAGLRSRLPENIRARGTIVSANSGSFPPYIIAGSDGKTMRGAVADLATAVSNILGVRIEHVTTDGFSSQLIGIDSGRYDFSMGPNGDTLERQKNHDFVDWIREYVVFAVRKGNPRAIHSLEDTCGLRISVQAGGAANTVIDEFSQECVKRGAPAVQVFAYKDQPTSILALQAGRVDAFFSSRAPLTYFTTLADRSLELAGTEASNGFEGLFQGSIVPKKSSLGPVLADAMNILMKNGTYQKIMDGWGLSANKINAAEINLVGKKND